MIVTHLFVSPEHVYVGHFGKPSGKVPMAEVDKIEVVTGRGVRGDRYFAHEEGHKGQVTFFSEEAWLRLRKEVGGADRGPGVFRRNVIVRGADLNALVGAEFEVQGVRFKGSEYCKPCFWMDEAFAPGTLKALAEWKAGGLRTRVLSDGCLRVDKTG